MADLEDRLRSNPDDASALARIAVAYLARGGETGDPAFLAKAAEAANRSLAIDRTAPTTLVAAGLVSLSRHDFAAALEYGRQAREVAPDSAHPLGIVVDAHVELGQYQEAAAAAQAMVDIRPSMASLARVSYLRELHGDRFGAIAAMAQALTAGSGVPADRADVQTLLGDLQRSGGDLSAAKRSYEGALATVDGFEPAEAGLARVAAAGGDLTAAVGRLEPIAGGTPSPETVTLLGDLYDATGRPAAATAQYDRVRQIEERNRAAGEAVDLELGRFEADHARDEGGRPELAVTLAHSAQAARPTVFADDVVGWALRQAGRPEEALRHARAATRLGTADGVLWYHLAVVEADLGMTGDARAHLGKAFEVSPFLGVREQPAAQALAAHLGLSRP